MHMPNFNAQIKKNSIAFDIDFENIKQNVLTTKKEDKSPKKVEVIPNVEDPNEEQKEQTLYKCPHCDRKFKREAYAKHVPVCARVFTNNKNIENNKEKEKEKKNDKKGFNKRAKWENQSDELRAIIQQKRAEQAEDNHKKKELKIEIEEEEKKKRLEEEKKKKEDEEKKKRKEEEEKKRKEEEERKKKEEEEERKIFKLI